MIRDTLQLVKPLQYLCIKNTRRGVYQLLLPFIMTFGIMFLYGHTDQPIEEIYQDVTSEVIGILQIMIPFTITALAAIATFPSQNLENKLAGEPAPYILRRKRGKIVKDTLNRRRYLCLLFGYIAFAGLLLILLIGAFSIISPFFNNLKICYVWFSLAVAVFLSSNLLVNTLLGIFYLSDRVHRDD